MRANTTPRPDARTAYATPQTDGKRIAWVDCAKALAIIGVMLVHTAIPDAAKHAIYVALIPLFFYLAGLFADVHKDLTPEVYLQRQWRRLLLPYFSFGLLHYVLWWTVGRHFGAAPFLLRLGRKTAILKARFDQGRTGEEENG